MEILCGDEDIGAKALLGGGGQEANSHLQQPDDGIAQGGGGFTADNDPAWMMPGRRMAMLGS